MLCPSSRWADHPSRFWSHIPSHLWSVRQRMATSNQWQRVSEFPAPLRRNLHHSALSPAQLKGQLQRNPRQQFLRNPDPKLNIRGSPVSTGIFHPFFQIVLVPPPQELEHADHSLQGTHLQSTGQPWMLHTPSSSALPTHALPPCAALTLPSQLPSVAICCMETTGSTRSKAKS